MKAQPFPETYRDSLFNGFGEALDARAQKKGGKVRRTRDVGKCKPKSSFLSFACANNLCIVKDFDEGESEQKSDGY